MQLDTQTAELCLSVLRSVYPEQIEFHAQRYTSAEKFRNLIRQAHDPEFGIDTLRGTLTVRIMMIAKSCAIDDGANYGKIPCLGGRPALVWQALLDVALSRCDRKLKRLDAEVTA